MEKQKMDWNDAECTLRMAIETLQQLVIDTVGEDSNINMINYNSHIGRWEITFFDGEDMEFEDFEEVYTWLRTEGQE